MDRPIVEAAILHLARDRELLADFKADPAGVGSRLGLDDGFIGLTICYDLRFPELYRRLALAGAEVIFVPSAFTRITGKAHWEALLRARAIENAAYVVASAIVGDDPSDGFPTYGHTLAIDPWARSLRTSERAIDHAR